MDRAGRLWRADNYFTGGVAQPGPADFLGRPPDPSLYRDHALRRLQLFHTGAARRVRIVAALCRAQLSQRNRCWKRGRRKRAALYSNAERYHPAERFRCRDRLRHLPGGRSRVPGHHPGGGWNGPSEVPGRRRPAVLECDRTGSRFARAHPSHPDSCRRLFRYRSFRQRLEPGQLLYRRTAGNSQRGCIADAGSRSLCKRAIRQFQLRHSCPSRRTLCRDTLLRRNLLGSRRPVNPQGRHRLADFQRVLQRDHAAVGLRHP